MGPQEIKRAERRRQLAEMLRRELRDNRGSVPLLTLLPRFQEVAVFTHRSALHFFVNSLPLTVPHIGPGWHNQREIILDRLAERFVSRELARRETPGELEFPPLGDPIFTNGSQSRG